MQEAIIVGGPNFGCGSGREEAGYGHEEAGLGALLRRADRLFTRNCINVGLPVVVSPGIDGQVTEGDEIEIDLAQGCIQSTAIRRERICRQWRRIARLIQDGGSYYTRRILDSADPR
jgi:3-isopropylmalate dehydratase small subunit